MFIEENHTKMNVQPRRTMRKERRQSMVGLSVVSSYLNGYCGRHYGVVAVRETVSVAL